MYTPTAADFADTGQWRMILNIREDGLDAWLENTLHPELPPQKLCESEWEKDSSSLLKHLENAVYESPRLLDDFATRIVLFDSHTLFVPTHVAEESSDSESELYNQIYEARQNDIMYDTSGELTAIWSMSPGVREFLLRTFPGARLTCNLLERVRTATGGHQPWTLYVTLRTLEADIVLANEGELICAATKPCKSDAELGRYVKETLSAYGRSEKDTGLNITDLR